jgi:hypothetical protein
MRGERGQTAAEYLGALLLVSVVIAAVAATDAGGRIRDGLTEQVCKIAGGARCAAPVADVEPPLPVPGMPPPPPLAEGDGGASGNEWGEDDPGIADRAKKELAKRAADAAELRGWENAARHLRHYLGNSGEPLEIDPARLLRDIEIFRTRAEGARLELIRDLQARAREAYSGQQITLYEDGRDGWRVGSPSDPAYLGDDWFYAMGGFSFAYTARAIVRPPADGSGEPTVQIDYQLHVFDRYNWDKGKSVNIGGVTIDDGFLGDLHRVGLAREYEIHGSTEIDSVTVGLNEHVQTAPPAEPAPDRDGEREDPNRDRGRGRGGR